MFKEEYLARRIIGAAMKLHTALGPGFKESVYHSGLIAALTKIGETSEIEVGLILNFGNQSLEFQRVVYYRKSA